MYFAPMHTKKYRSYLPDISRIFTKTSKKNNFFFMFDERMRTSVRNENEMKTNEERNRENYCKKLETIELSCMRKKTSFYSSSVINGYDLQNF